MLKTGKQFRDLLELLVYYQDRGYYTASKDMREDCFYYQLVNSGDPTMSLVVIGTLESYTIKTFVQCADKRINTHTLTSLWK